MSAWNWFTAVAAIWGAVSIMTAATYAVLRRCGWGGPR